MSKLPCLLVALVACAPAARRPVPTSPPAAAPAPRATPEPAAFAALDAADEAPGAIASGGGAAFAIRRDPLHVTVRWDRDPWTVAHEVVKLLGPPTGGMCSVRCWWGEHARFTVHLTRTGQWATLELL
jgi:hypothetical protein